MTIYAEPGTSFSDKNTRKTLSPREVAAACAGALALALVYIFTRTANHNYDAVSYALAADVKDATSFFHQHHLLFTPANWLVLSALRVCGYGGEALPVIAAISAFTAAAAAALFYVFLRTIGIRKWVAGAAVIGSALAASWWYFAGEAELASVISFFTALALNVLARPGPPLRKAAITGAVLGLGILFHETLVLFSPVAAVILLWDVGKRLKKLLAFIGVLAAVVIPLYVIIPIAYYRVHFPGEWFSWLLGYVTVGTWGHGTPFSNGAAITTFLGSFVAGPKAPDLSGRVTITLLARNYLPALLVSLFWVTTTAMGWKRAWVAGNGRWLVGMVVAIAVSYVFFGWWEPLNAHWWIGAATGCWLLAALTAPTGRWWPVIAALIAVAAAGLNLFRLILPATSTPTDDMGTLARGIVGASEEEACFIASDPDLRLWLAYAGRNTHEIIPAFEAGKAGRYRKVEKHIMSIFPDYRARGAHIYFTDLEWSASGTQGPANEKMRAVLYKLQQPARFITSFPYRGRYIGMYEYTAYANNLKDLSVVEVTSPLPPAGKPFWTLNDNAAVDVGCPLEGTYVFDIQAYGFPCLGSWPSMGVSLDGRDIGTVTVNERYWRFYRSVSPAAAGTHTLGLSFLNDFTDAKSGTSRDFYVGRVAAYRIAAGPDKGAPPGR